MFCSMAVSLEAMAMAGVDYSEYNLDAEEWDRQHSLLHPPPHLLIYPKIKTKCKINPCPHHHHEPTTQIKNQPRQKGITYLLFIHH